MGVSRREFIRNSAAAAAAATASAHAATFPSVNTHAGFDDAGKVKPPDFPYGAVYFRKSNPPESDWARDHQTAARIGMNTFRHWFMWSVIETAPGKYNWDGYDQMLDLAAKNGIKVIIAEMITCAPEWAFDKYPHARFRANDGFIVESTVSASSETGGYPGLCLDNPDVHDLAEKFLTALIERYRSHPALLGYDLWNENTSWGGTPQRMYCFCDATRRRFREWLKKKYQSLNDLENTWHRYSYESWDQVQPPPTLAGYPESLDWLQFRIDNAYDLFDWRVQLVRRLDPHHQVTAHGVAETVENLPSQSHQEWLSAKRVDIYGYTWIASQYGDEPWRQYSAVDIVRAGSRGKPFWHAEAEAGPPPISPERPGMDPKYRRNPVPEDVRLWNLTSCAGGARGILYPRWRPLLDGPLFGAFGAFAMDGSVTPRAEMAGRVARWANAHPELWKSSPVKGDVGLAFVPEAEIFNYMQQGSTEFYAQSIRGAYQAFFDSNIQADFVAVDDLAEYKLVYLPYPVMLREETAARLRAYVEQGGFLISEGMPGYFNEHGHVGTVQPNYGLDKVFGATQADVEFIPDISDSITLTVMNAKVYGSYFRQQYQISGGEEAGQFANGTIAAVTHRFGKGRTLLIGSFPGAGYYHHHEAATKELFASFLKLAVIEPLLRTDNCSVQARLHDGAGGTHLWVTNPTWTDQSVSIVLGRGVGDFRSAEDVWGKQSAHLSGQGLSVVIPARDAVVLTLK